MADTTLNYYALAYSIFTNATSGQALSYFNIRQRQDTTKRCRHIAYAEKVRDMIVNKKMRKIDVQKELGISREILDAALKYAKVPKQDYRKVKHND